MLLLPFQPRKRVIPNGSASLGILGVMYAVTLLKPRKNGKGQNQQSYALKVFTLDKNIFWLACAFSAIGCVTTLMGGNKSAQMLATASATLMVGGGITRLVSLVLYILFYLTDKDNRGLLGSRGVGRYPHSVADIHPVIYFFSREGVLFPPAKKKSGACYKTCIGYECTDLYYVARATANGWPSFLHP